MITVSNSNSSGWSSFTSTNASSGASSGSGGSGGSPNSNNSMHPFFSDDSRARRNNNIVSWLDNCFREGEVGTVKANNPLKILIYTSTSTGPSRDQGPGQW